jgi:hypothetical protein
MERFPPDRGTRLLIKPLCESCGWYTCRHWTAFGWAEHATGGVGTEGCIAVSNRRKGLYLQGVSNFSMTSSSSRIREL